MADRTRIFIAYSYPDKRWFDRLHAALLPLVGKESLMIWDDRQLRSRPGWQAELPEVLASSKIVMMIVSDLFLQSDFVTRAKLPRLIEREREKGLQIAWVLASQCLFEGAGLKESESASDINSALDGLSSASREPELATIARKVALLYGVAAPPAAADLEQTGDAATVLVNTKSAFAEAATLGLVTPPSDRPRAEANFNLSEAREQKAKKRKRPATGGAPPGSGDASALLLPLENAAPASLGAPAAPEPSDLPVAASAEPASEFVEAPSPALSTASADVPVVDGPAEPVGAAMPTTPKPATRSPVLDSLDAVIQERQETTRKLNRVMRSLLAVALASALAALLAGVFSTTHLLFVAGFGAFIASLSWLVHARVNLLGQEMVRMRYTRSGLADESLPARQRAPLLQKAEEMLG